MPTASSAFDFSVQGIAQIFKSHRLIVPPYQREYSWELEQVKQLLSDLLSARSEGRSYFLGTIVTIKKEGHPLEIVDGQQRLTTTYLLILAFRKHLEALDATANGLRIESINTDYLNTIDRDANERVPKLQLNVDDNEYFSLAISANAAAATESRQSHERIKDARQAAQHWVTELCSTHEPSVVPDVINGWLGFLDAQAEVVLLQTENGAQAFKMFETLNDRGLRTSQVDLVKSYLFSQSEGRITEAQSHWSAMRENLEEIDDEDRAINFLRHSITATRKFVRSEQIYDVTQQSVRGTTDTISFLNELAQLSRAYAATFSPSSDFWSDHTVGSQRALTEINRFGIKSLRPLLMSVGMKFSAGELENSLRLLLSISVRLIVGQGTRTGVVEQTFGDAALSVFRGEVTNTSSLRDRLDAVVVSDIDFSEAFQNLKSSKPELARYYLRALEARKSGQDEPWFVPNEDAAEVTLEHVLPKKLSQEEWGQFNEEQHRATLKRLGNMCLMPRSQNSNIGNASFADKKTSYGDASYYWTAHIADFEDWNVEAIDQRQQEMADIAIQTWPV